MAYVHNSLLRSSASKSIHQRVNSKETCSVLFKIVADDQGLLNPIDSSFRNQDHGPGYEAVQVHLVFKQLFDWPLVSLLFGWSFGS